MDRLSRLAEIPSLQILDAGTLRRTLKVLSLRVLEVDTWFKQSLFTFMKIWTIKILYEH